MLPILATCEFVAGIRESLALKAAGDDRRTNPCLPQQSQLFLLRTLDLERRPSPPDALISHSLSAWKHGRLLPVRHTRLSLLRCFPALARNK